MFWELLLDNSLGFRNICLETDSACVSQLVDQEVQPTQAHVTLMNAVQGLLSEDLNIEIRHLYREANKCADMLTKIGHRLSLGPTFYDRLSLSPVYLQSFLRVQLSTVACALLLCLFFSLDLGPDVHKKRRRKYRKN